MNDGWEGELRVSDRRVTGGMVNYGRLTDGRVYCGESRVSDGWEGELRVGGGCEGELRVNDGRVTGGGWITGE